MRRRAATLPGGKGAVAVLREDAFKRFDARGLPHRRVEEWKYTDLRALMREAAPLAAPPDAAAKARAKDAGKLFAGSIAAGWCSSTAAFVPELSDLTRGAGADRRLAGRGAGQGRCARRRYRQDGWRPTMSRWRSTRR